MLFRLVEKWFQDALNQQNCQSCKNVDNIPGKDAIWAIFLHLTSVFFLATREISMRNNHHGENRRKKTQNKRLPKSKICFLL